MNKTANQFDYSITRAEILKDVAEELGKPVSEMVPWEDYDPIWLDDRIQAAKHEACCYGPRWTGD